MKTVTSFFAFIVFLAAFHISIEPIQAFCLCGAEARKVRSVGFEGWGVTYYTGGLEHSKFWGQKKIAIMTKSQYDIFRSKFQYQILREKTKSDSYVGFSGLGGKIDTYLSKSNAAIGHTVVASRDVVRRKRQLRRGDTLRNILLKNYGISTRKLLFAIANYNGLQHPDKINAGDKLMLPEINNFKKFNWKKQKEKFILNYLKNRPARERMPKKETNHGLLLEQTRASLAGV